MKAKPDKAPENKSQITANEATQAPGGGEGLAQFVDNRPETAQLQQLQGMADQFSAQTQLPIQKKKNDTGLPDNLKSGIENLSGMSMDDVKVHRNSDKPAQLNAHAYAQGSDIHLASGQEKHLPHEAWHVVQQKQGRVKPTMQMKGKVNINDDAGLEKEADLMGVKSMSSDNLITNNDTNTDSTGNLNPSPKQLMVAVAGGLSTFNKKDFTQLSHLDWAMKISGGPLVGLNPSIQAIGKSEDLHLVQHGQKGAMVHQINASDQWKAVTAKTIADLFIAYLPVDYEGRIRVSSCYSGTLTDISNKDSSLVKQIKTMIKASKRDDLKEVWIVGWDGPTITNINLQSDSGTGAETVDPSKVPQIAKLQDNLLGGKYKQLKEEWEKNVGKDSRPLDELAAAAAMDFQEFYQEFTKLCKDDGALLNYVDSLVIA